MNKLNFDRMYQEFEMKEQAEDMKALGENLGRAITDMEKTQYNELIVLMNLRFNPSWISARMELSRN